MHALFTSGSDSRVAAFDRRPAARIGQRSRKPGARLVAAQPRFRAHHAVRPQAQINQPEVNETASESNSVGAYRRIYLRAIVAADHARSSLPPLPPQDA
jgi:hypothetical protein